MITIKSNEFGYHLVQEEPVVAHCHHYNTTLQETLISADYLNETTYLSLAAAETVYPVFITEFQHLTTQEEKLSYATELCKTLGYGSFAFKNISEQSAVVEAEVSHYSLGWKSKFGPSSEPVDHFMCGVLKAIVTALYSKRYEVSQVACIAMGHQKNVYQIHHVSAQPDLKMPEYHTVPLIHAPKDQFQSAIDPEAITTAVKGLNLAGNEEGIIDAFGVYLTMMFGNYYNRIIYNFERKLIEQGSMPELSEALLIEAGHNCGFYTMGNIMESPEFHALVGSKTSEKRDWMHGIISVINALGWGSWRLNQLVDNQKMVLHVYNSYEAVGYRKFYGIENRCVCHMIKGVASSLMNLLYMGRIQSKPDLVKAFYDELFSAEHSFHAIETKCSATGQSSFCEFIIEKK